MISINDMRKLLKETGLPVAYRCFPENKAPDLPYICYLTPYSNNFAADGQVYYKKDHMQVELYCRKKDVELEEKVEQALSSFFWEKEENYIDSEKCYQITYAMEV